MFLDGTTACETPLDLFGLVFRSLGGGPFLPHTQLTQEEWTGAGMKRNEKPPHPPAISPTLTRDDQQR